MFPWIQNDILDLVEGSNVDRLHMILKLHDLLLQDVSSNLEPIDTVAMQY